jgi:hypothetical protein
VIAVPAAWARPSSAARQGLGCETPQRAGCLAGGVAAARRGERPKALRHQTTTLTAGVPHWPQGFQSVTAPHCGTYPATERSSPLQRRDPGLQPSRSARGGASPIFSAPSRLALPSTLAPSGASRVLSSVLADSVASVGCVRRAPAPAPGGRARRRGTLELRRTGRASSARIGSQRSKVAGRQLHRRRPRGSLLSVVTSAHGLRVAAQRLRRRCCGGRLRRRASARLRREGCTSSACDERCHSRPETVCVRCVVAPTPSLGALVLACVLLGCAWGHAESCPTAWAPATWCWVVHCACVCFCASVCSWGHVEMPHCAHGMACASRIEVALNRPIGAWVVVCLWRGQC